MERALGALVLVLSLALPGCQSGKARIAGLKEQLSSGALTIGSPMPVTFEEWIQDGREESEHDRYTVLVHRSEGSVLTLFAREGKLIGACSFSPEDRPRVRWYFADEEAMAKHMKAFEKPPSFPGT